MDETEIQSPLPYKIVLVAVALLAAASLAAALYLFVDLRSKMSTWNDEKAAFERQIAKVEEDRRNLRAELEQIQASGREADEASRRLAAIEAEIRQKEVILKNLAQRTLSTQAGLDSALRRQQELASETATIERQLDQATSRLAPLAAELENRTVEYRELESVLKQARDGLDRAIERFESLGATTTTE